MTEWTSEWPTKPGYYWFYGQRLEQQSTGLYCVRVYIGLRNYVCYTTNGHFIYNRDGAKGVWQPIRVPELPEEWNG